jgi:cytochrome c553
MTTHPRSLTTSALLIVAAVGLTAFVTGFFILPSQDPFDTLWQRMCRAAGIVRNPQRGARQVAPPTLTSVVIPNTALDVGSPEQIGRGATLALRCTVCHGAQGLSGADAPNLSGQYPEVIYKQLVDYQRGARIDPVMSAMATSMSEADVLDVAYYYAYLPRSRNILPLAQSPALVRVGDPMRSIAPCDSCHGHEQRKTGAPSLDGEPRTYLNSQLRAFASGRRKNDTNAAMRSVARQLSPAETGLLTTYYAGASR